MTTEDNMEGGGQPIFRVSDIERARQLRATAAKTRTANQRRVAQEEAGRAAAARAADKRRAARAAVRKAAAARAAEQRRFAREAVRKAKLKTAAKRRADQARAKARADAKKRKARAAAKRNPLKKMGTIIDQAASASGGIRPGRKATAAHIKARSGAKLRQQRDIDSQVKSATGGSTLVGIGRTANPQLSFVPKLPKSKSKKGLTTVNIRSINSQVKSAEGGGKPADPVVPMRDVNLSPKGPVTTNPPWPKDISFLEFIVLGSPSVGKPLTQEERKRWAIGVVRMDKILSELRAASGGQTQDFKALRKAWKRLNKLSKSQFRELESQIKAASGGTKPDIMKQRPKRTPLLPADKLVGLGPKPTRWLST